MNRPPHPKRLAREWALRALYQIDTASKSPEEALEEVLSVAQLPTDLANYVKDLVLGTAQHQITELDPLIEQFARGWTIERMAVIDRNILRLALYELRYHPEVPYASVINEAVELAKRYSTAESGRFVNGVLGAIARQMYPDSEGE